jgi:hypothetical protein
MKKCDNRYSELHGLCDGTAENYAEAALNTEPFGVFWNKKKTTNKAKIHLSFGAILEKFNSRMCDFFAESLACGSIELIAEWEEFYGLPRKCSDTQITSIQDRQAAICATRKNKGLKKLSDLQEFIRLQIGCDFITIEQKLNEYGNLIGICVKGVSSGEVIPKIFSRVGGSTGGLSKKLVLDDPSYTQPENCGLTTYSRVGGSTGGVGKHLVWGDEMYYRLICLLDAHVPMHLAIFFCD